MKKKLFRFLRESHDIFRNSSHGKKNIEFDMKKTSSLRSLQFLFFSVVRKVRKVNRSKKNHLHPFNVYFVHILTERLKLLLAVLRLSVVLFFTQQKML